MKNTETHFELVLENCPNVRMQLDDTDKVVEALKQLVKIKQGFRLHPYTPLPEAPVLSLEKEVKR